MEELARRRAELIIVTLEEEEVKVEAKEADVRASRRMRIGRILAEADTD